MVAMHDFAHISITGPPSRQAGRCCDAVLHTGAYHDGIADRAVQSIVCVQPQDVRSRIAERCRCRSLLRVGKCDRAGAVDLAPPYRKHAFSGPPIVDYGPQPAVNALPKVAEVEPNDVDRASCSSRHSYAASTTPSTESPVATSNPATSTSTVGPP